MSLAVISFVIATVYLAINFKGLPQIQTRLKARHFLATVAVVTLTASEPDILYYVLIHTQASINHYFVSKGFEPAWFQFCLILAESVLGTAVWLTGFSLAFGKPKARKRFM